MNQPNNILEQKMLQNEAVYRAACEIFAQPSRVFRYYDQHDEISVDLLTAENSPCEGVTSYSSLGLIHYPLGLRADGKPLRAEIAGACYDRFEYYPNLLSSCAFEIMNSHFVCAHGVVYPECVNMYVQGSPMRHLLFVQPDEETARYWEQPLNPLDFADKRAVWLLAVPISDSELEYLRDQGTEALLDRLREVRADPFDLERKPVL